MFKIEISIYDLSGSTPMSNNNIWLDEIIEILTELGVTETLYQIKTKVIERIKIDLIR